jgi:hypothetical protein
MVLRAIDCGWLDQVETAIVCEALSRREDYTLEELRFDFIDEQLRVAFIDDVACCDPGALLALLRRLRCGLGKHGAGPL